MVPDAPCRVRGPLTKLYLLLAVVNRRAPDRTNVVPPRTDQSTPTRPEHDTREIRAKSGIAIRIWESPTLDWASILPVIVLG